MEERWTVLFSGDVQGVGFRYTAVSIARRFASVGGYIRNLPDGRVELIAEGRREELKAFVEEIRSVMRGCVAGVAVSRSEATGEFALFGVRY